MATNSFGARATLKSGGKSWTIHKLDALERRGFNLAKIPFSIRVMLENVLRREDGVNVTAEQVETLAKWDGKPSQREISFRPARVLLQDFTGVPVVADLAVMRDAIKRLGGDPAKINPLQPVDLVIDHSVQVDAYGSADAFAINARMEFQRNRERYLFLRWGQGAFDNFRVVPPDTGIVHQVNLEYLAPVVFGARDGSAYPDTVLGTDSHTTMINGLGVVGWGVGGIEAEAAMLGRSIPMLIPEVVGFRLHGSMRPGCDRDRPGADRHADAAQEGRGRKIRRVFRCRDLARCRVADRATLGNMSPEYGATIGFFPVDDQTLEYLRMTGRAEEQVDLVEAYCKEQGLFRTEATPEPHFSDVLDLDLAEVEPSLAGPRRPQDRVPLHAAKNDVSPRCSPRKSRITSLRIRRSSSAGFPRAGILASLRMSAVRRRARSSGAQRRDDSRGRQVLAQPRLGDYRGDHQLHQYLESFGDDRGRNAREKSRRARTHRQPWVKTSLAPGSKVVTRISQACGADRATAEAQFNLVGYGCTTCIGNSGPMRRDIADGDQNGNLVAAAVLSGNRNFEGRINPVVRFNYLASPPLVVAYAIAGTMDIDLNPSRWETIRRGKPVYLERSGRVPEEIAAAVKSSIDSEMFRDAYGKVFEGDERWRGLAVPKGNLFQWDNDSEYVKAPPFFDGVGKSRAV